jgi:hypothetical protein
MFIRNRSTNCKFMRFHFACNLCWITLAVVPSKANGGIDRRGSHGSGCCLGGHFLPRSLKTAKALGIAGAAPLLAICDKAVR